MSGQHLDLQTREPELTIIRIAIAIVNLFTSGGLQRDCLGIARRLKARGHEVTLFCRACETPLPEFDVTVLPNRALTNHGRNTRFGRDLAKTVKAGFDVVAGFDKMPGLDILYCADPPLRLRRPVSDRLTPRYATMRTLEAACFAPGAATRLLLLSDVQRQGYERQWNTDSGRITVLPPTIERSRAVPEARAGDLRTRLRASLGLGDAEKAWLFIGAFPRTKGLDRLIEALPSFPDAKLLCVGFAANDPKQRSFPDRARALDVDHRITWLGAREDIPALMAASDLLVHPSRLDTTGTVILEALANGLPVVTTAACGYAPHVTVADAGIVLDEPFAQNDLVAALETASNPSTLARWSGNAVRYSAAADLYSGLDVAADAIIETGARLTQ